MWTRFARNLALAACATASVVLYVPLDAGAIPVFARKYETSCQTCHVAFPKLTPFGEAFRRNGFRFPGEDEEGASKDEPIELGQRVHLKMFPDAVLPGDIPGRVPLAAGIQTGWRYGAAGGGHGHGASAAVPPLATGGGHVEADKGLAFSGTEVSVYAAGTMGEMLSFFAKLEAGTADGEIMVERPNVIFKPFGSSALLVKVGAFEPGLHSFSIHRNLTGHSLNYTSSSVGDNGWSPEPDQLGVEAWGVLADGRLGYTLGVAEGRANSANRAKDFYGRVDYKIGGMRLDGIGGATSSSPWAEWSLLAGVSAYKGFATFADPQGSGGFQSDHFLRLGGDLNAMLGDVNLTTAYFLQRHERPVYGRDETGTLRGVLAQADWVIFPWLVLTGRQEWFVQKLPGGQVGNGHRSNVALNALLRANVNLRVMAGAAKNPGTGYEFDSVMATLATAF